MLPHVERAESLLELGRAGQAEQVLRDGLAEDPDDPAALSLLAHALLELERPGEALAEAERATSLAPDVEWVHRLRSVALFDLRRYEEAVTAANDAVRADPQAWQPHVQYAFAAARIPRFGQQALAAARRAVELAPEQADPHFALGTVADQLRRYDESRAHYERALAIDPTHAGARNNLTTSHGSRLDLAGQLAGYAAVLGDSPGLDVARANVERLAHAFVRRLYWGAVVALLLCLFASLGDGSAAFRAIVGVAMLVATIAWSIGVCRRVPEGIRLFVRERMLRVPFHLASVVLSAVMLLAACWAAFAPVTDWFVPWVVRPLGFANVGLLVWGVVRLADDD